MKEFVKGLSDKASNYLDTKGLANPVEVINEELGGETREESKVRRAKAKEPAKEITIEKEVIVKPQKFKAGGSASSRADGCAVRGKTRGTIVMCGGGYMKGKK
jgi:hypothetical protein